ncbi:hypothetical protein, partial [Paraglaciecola chathamensis]|uniref:hypothetical protein n=1 Tax=Paraglaciecola chathamensis TaxID=368405 RepID=UPI0023573339
YPSQHPHSFKKRLQNHVRQRPCKNPNKEGAGDYMQDDSQDTHRLSRHWIFGRTITDSISWINLC